MRQVIGRSTAELSGAEWAVRRADYSHLLLDIGTGDGKHALATARARPDTLVIGLDASPDALRAASQRAAAKPARGGVPNAIFLWAVAEALPGELSDVDEVHALMPWGSLLRGIIGADGPLLRGIAAACRPATPFLITLNLHAWRPPVPEVSELAEPTSASALAQLAADYAAAGWRIDAADYSGRAELAELGTSWTRRLGSSRAELAVLALRGLINPPPGG